MPLPLALEVGLRAYLEVVMAIKLAKDPPGVKIPSRSFHLRICFIKS